MFYKILLCLTLIFGSSIYASNQKVYVKCPEKAFQVNATIKKPNGECENTTWFRLPHMQHGVADGGYYDVSSVHGDQYGVFFFDQDIKNTDPVKKWSLEYHVLFACENCGMLHDHYAPPCMNPACPSNNRMQ